MALVFEQFLTEELGDASYLVGDDEAASAAVVDPQLDLDRYLDCARRHGLAIRHVVQTHIHEDYLSGAAALAAACGAGRVSISGHDAPRYGFAHRLVHDGDTLDLGGVVLTVRHTPGHTPEHVALLVAKTGQTDAPFAVLSGGSLLVGAAGRTDLLGSERAQQLAAAQFRTLRQFFLALDDGVLVYPTHVHGSPCGAAIGDRTCTTIGYERRHNPLLQHDDESAFREAALGDLPPKPRYYPRLKDRNIERQPERGDLPRVAALPADSFRKALESADAVLVDTRSMLAFGGAHIAGAVNIGAGGHLGIWAGWMLDADKPLLLVLDDDQRLPAVLRQFSRTGFDRFAGYLAGGMSGWQEAGYPLASTRQVHVRRLAEEHKQRSLLAVDVRSPQEWQKGHVPGAVHIFLPDLESSLNRLDKDRSLAVYCDSGYRASIGASLLQARGYDAANVPGSWQAWSALDLPVEKPDEG